MRLKLIAAETWSIYAPCADDGSTFLDDDAIDEGELAKLAALLERMVEHGPTVIPESRNHQVDAKHKLFQLRVDQLRVIWFYDVGRVVVCAHSYRKKTQRAPRGEVKAACRVREEYFLAKEQRRLRVIDEV